MQDAQNDNPFDEETWGLLPSYLEKLPNPVQIHLWADPESGQGEGEAFRLVKTLAGRFRQIDAATFPRRSNYLYYPVLGIFGLDEKEAIDYGVRLIGLPSGYQMTSLIAAIQAVSFKGASVEAKTRYLLQALDQDVRLELLTAANDEAGAVIAKTVFGLAVASPYIRAFLIMADVFPVASVKYSASYLPHLVINGRSHIDGIIEEEELLKKIAAVLH